MLIQSSLPFICPNTLAKSELENCRCSRQLVLSRVGFVPAHYQRGLFRYGEKCKISMKLPKGFGVVAMPSGMGRFMAKLAMLGKGGY